MVFVGHIPGRVQALGIRIVYPHRQTEKLHHPVPDHFPGGTASSSPVQSSQRMIIVSITM